MRPGLQCQAHGSIGCARHQPPRCVHGVVLLLLLLLRVQMIATLLYVLRGLQSYVCVMNEVRATHVWCEYGRMMLCIG